jgi:hypothetical protein
MPGTGHAGRLTGQAIVRECARARYHARADGSVSFSLDPPGFPPLHLNLENGYFGDPDSIVFDYFGDDFTGLREGDRVHGMLSRDGRSLDRLQINVKDRFRYTFGGST